MSEVNPPYGPGQWHPDNGSGGVHGDRTGDYYSTGLPQRTPGRIEDAPTAANLQAPYPVSDEDREDWRQRFLAAQNQPPQFIAPDPGPPEIVTLEAVHGAPWNGFDTFLRRAVMIAAMILLWLLVGIAAVVIFGGGYALSQLGGDEPSYVEQPLIGTDEPLLPPEEEITP